MKEQEQEQKMTFSTKIRMLRNYLALKGVELKAEAVKSEAILDEVFTRRFGEEIKPEHDPIEVFSYAEEMGNWAAEAAMAETFITIASMVNKIIEKHPEA